MSDYMTSPVNPAPVVTPPPASKPNSTMAVISLIGGIAGFTVLPFLGSLAAIIFGHIAKGEIKKSGGTMGGSGMATAGLVMGYIAIGLTVCGLCVWGLIAVILPLLGLGYAGYSGY